MTATTDGLAAAPDQKRAAPVDEIGQRIVSLDFVRGIAVMGILLANIISFGQPSTAYMWPGGFLVHTGDPGGWQWIAQFVAVDGKMRGLFSLLFGAGVYLFMEKAWERGRSRWLQARRLFWLGLFGFAHFLLLWRGDILLLYSLCGFILLATLRWTPTTQIVVAAMVYTIASLLFSALYWFMYLVAETPLGDGEQFADAAKGMEGVKTGPVADAATQTAIMQDGTYLELVMHRLTEHGFDWIGMLMFVSWETIPLMLFGAALYRLGLFDGRMDPRKVRLWGWLGVIVGSAVTLALALWVKSVGFTYFSTMSAFNASMLPRLFVILGLAALLSFYGARARGWLSTRVAATGRMAFSNYLGTSFVLLFVFAPWALELFGRLNRPELYGVVLAMWALMLAWSKPWLERYRYGPLEWLWRCLTYGRLFPLRR